MFTLAACGGGGGTPISGSSSTPTPTTPSTQLDVSPCLVQTVSGRTVASLVVPDVVTLDLSKPNGFPNGRQFNDPVIDLELAALLLDLKTHPVDTLAKMPLNPGVDNVLQPNFPYIGVANGATPAAVGGGGFVFRTEDPSDYTRVDRMGEPAVATALVRSASKSAFNDDSPSADATGKWVNEFTETLRILATQLKDDFAARNLKTCAV